MPDDPMIQVSSPPRENRRAKATSKQRLQHRRQVQLQPRATMMPEGMGFDMDTLKALTLGSGEISLDALKEFRIKCYELTFAVWATDRSNPPERQELKQEFIELMRDHVWVPTIACIIYAVIVFVGPSLVRSPWPVRACRC
jgi:hypothetical protein